MRSLKIVASCEYFMVYYQIILVKASVRLETNFYPDSICLTGRQEKSLHQGGVQECCYGQWSGCRLTRGGGAFVTGMPVGLHNQKGGTFCLQN
jgi:hypothetical protein